MELKQLIAKVTGTTLAEDIRLGDRLHEDVGLDSLEMADLLVAIESQFGVVITAPMLADVQTVADLESAIRNASCVAE